MLWMRHRKSQSAWLTVTFAVGEVGAYKVGFSEWDLVTLDRLDNPVMA